MPEVVAAQISFCNPLTKAPEYSANPPISIGKSGMNTDVGKKSNATNANTSNRKIIHRVRIRYGDANENRCLDASRRRCPQ